MAEALIQIEGSETPLAVRLNEPDQTFNLKTDLIRATCRAELDPLSVDLLEISATVFAADSAVKRGGATRPGMGEDWRRGFNFKIPVRNPAFWNRQEVREALVDVVGFLTEDTVSFEFFQKPPDISAQPFLNLDPAGATYDAEEVILFSGGLDSFAGALEALSTSSGKVILLTHRSAQKAIPRQVNLGQYLADRFPDRVLHIHVLARRVGQEASDSSQRSRSFLFAALGQLVARTFGARRLSFYENGVISHNLPISAQVVGTMATRTTHPLSIRKLNALIALIQPDHVPIENRYCWLTKRDVVDRIAQNNGQDQIPKSVSCTSIREQTKQHSHCGTCSQCLDRRFALLAAGLGQFDFATDYGTDILFGAREKPHSQTMAVEWTRHALRLPDIDPHTFLTAFGTEFARIAEGHPEESKQAIMDRCVAMHSRHGVSVGEVFQQVWSERSSDILQGNLPPTSLVALMLAQAGSSVSVLLTDPCTTTSRVSASIEDDEFDLVPDPDKPLRVEIAEENGLRVMKIEGLCVLRGPQAKVPCGLVPIFLEDRASGLHPKDHRYVLGGTLAIEQGLTKSAIRKQVTRSRKELCDSFEAIHGRKLNDDRFIQSRPPKGYRLAPTIDFVRNDEY